jgi:hypothetical protein
MSEVVQLIAVIKERDRNTAAQMQELRQSMKEMSDNQAKSNANFAMFYKHIAIADEDKKHDAEFKKEVRTFIKDSTPVILKAKDAQEVRGKLLIAAGSFIMLGVLAFFFKF